MKIVRRHWAGRFYLFLQHTIRKNQAKMLSQKLKKICPGDLQKSLKTKKMFFASRMKYSSGKCIIMQRFWILQTLFVEINNGCRIRPCHREFEKNSVQKTSHQAQMRKSGGLISFPNLSSTYLKEISLCISLVDLC